MKTAFTALKMVSVMSIALFLGSCTKDNDPTPSDLILGNWQISNVNVTMKVGSQSLYDYLISQGVPAADAAEFVDLLEGDFGGVDGNIEIKAGGTYSSTSDGITDTGTWELSADGKTLTLDKGTVDAFVLTVASLTATSLTLTSDQSETEDDLTYTIHIEMTLTK